MAKDRKKQLKYRQTKGNNSCTTDDILLKLYMHHQPMVIYTQYKFDDIPSVAY